MGETKCDADSLGWRTLFASESVRALGPLPCGGALCSHHYPRTFHDILVCTVLPPLYVQIPCAQDTIFPTVPSQNLLLLCVSLFVTFHPMFCSSFFTGPSGMLSVSLVSQLSRVPLPKIPILSFVHQGGHILSPVEVTDCCGMSCSFHSTQLGLL